MRRCASLLALLLALAACGGSGTPSASSGTAIGTLAYVVTECSEDRDAFFARQTLQIRQGDRAPVTALQGPTVGPVLPIGLCRAFGQLRSGLASPAAGLFQRIGVTPDGSAVVFEVTDAFSLLGHDLLTAEQRGIFIVRADGTGLNRIGDSSRVPTVVVQGTSGLPYFNFSPNGRTVTFLDLGPGPAGEEAEQIFTLDIVTGERAQVTHFPLVVPSDPSLAVINGPSFFGDHTISFASIANPDGSNPDGNNVQFLIAVDGSNLRAFVPVAGPGGLVQTFHITGGQRDYENVVVAPHVVEVFVNDGTNLLQLTNYGREDTGASIGPSVDGQRVFFTASADPLGANPSENCQLFSIDPLGTNLRQLTRFSEGAHSTLGCNPGAPPGCWVFFFNGFAPSQDAHTGTLIFESSCDPFGTNPDGGQLFAMGADGSGLRQLTNVRGTVIGADRSVTVELPGPWAYGPYR